MNRKLLAVSLLVVSGAVYWIISGRSASMANPEVEVNQLKVTPTAKPTPSPTPLPINKGTNLEQTLDSLTPEDYSDDYSNLTEK